MTELEQLLDAIERCIAEQKAANLRQKVANSYMLRIAKALEAIAGDNDGEA